MKTLFSILAMLVSVAYGRMAYQFANDVDYIVDDPIQEIFTCEGRPYGYYADEANACQIFHICVPYADEIGALAGTDHFSFACGTGTIFSQDTLTCSHRDSAFPCGQARSLYDISNSEFGLVADDYDDQDFQNKKK